MYLNVGEWINKLWSLQEREYYSRLKRDELSRHEMTWRNHQCVLLSERNQCEKVTYCMTTTARHSRRGKMIRQ